MFGNKKKTLEQIKQDREKELLHANEENYTKALKAICYEKEENGTVYERSLQGIKSLSLNYARTLFNVINREQNPNPDTPSRVLFSSPEFFASGGEAVLIRAKEEISGDEVVIKFIKPFVIAKPGQKQKVMKQDKDGVWKPARFKKITGPEAKIETENTLRFQFGAENQQKVHNCLKKDFGFSIGYVPRIIAIGKTPKLYLVQEYIEGSKSLDYIRTNNLCDEERITLFLDLLDVVAVIHDSHIIHRDLTPDNILIMKNGKPCVVDFSLSKNMSQPHELTSMDVSFGKMSFASLHQLTNTAKANYKDDNHTLAKVFWCFFMGHLPNKTPENFSWDDAYDWGKVPKEVFPILQNALQRKYVEVSDLQKDIEEIFPRNRNVIVEKKPGHTEINKSLKKLKSDLSKTHKIIKAKFDQDKKSDRTKEFDDRIRAIEKRFDIIEEKVLILENINMKIYDFLLSQRKEKRTK